MKFLFRSYFTLFNEIQRHQWAIFLYLISVQFLASNPIYADRLSDQRAEYLEFHFDPSDSSYEERNYRAGIEKLFKNKALVSGLNSGSDAINRGIETLMESIFYSLLDQQLFFPAETPLRLGMGWNRDTYGTSFGDYVIVDRFDLGPTYLKQIGQLGLIPIYLGIDQRNTVYDIYLRSDGQRLQEAEERGPIFEFFANWFGLLPFLSSILPPSFESNEMYDPLRLVKVPLSFPLEAEQLKKMPNSSVRSYSVSGALSFQANIASVFSNDFHQKLKKFEDFDLSIPYRVIVEGEYKINILKKSEHEVWLGLVKTDSFGHGFATRVGNVIYIFNKLSPLWKGLATPIFPIDLEIETRLRWKLDTVYSYDLRDEYAKKALKAATLGDLSLSETYWNQSTKQNEYSGVKFLFHKISKGPVHNDSIGPNIFLYKSKIETSISSQQVLRSNPMLSQRTLEIDTNYKSSSWDIFVGNESLDYSGFAETKLKEAETILLNLQSTNPFSIQLSMEIQDRFTETAEYVKYLDLLKKFLNAKLYSLPSFPIRDPSRLERRRRRQSLMAPHQKELHLHITPTHLGFFGARANILLNEKNIKNITKKTDFEIWKAIGNAFGRSKSFTHKSFENTYSSVHLGHTFSEYFLANALIPTKLFNFENTWFNAYPEGMKIVSEIKEISQQISNAEGINLAFKKLLETPYPLQVSQILLNLSGSDTFRELSFTAKAKGKLEEESKEKFLKLNDIKIELGKNNEDLGELKKVDSILHEFSPDHPVHRKTKFFLRSTKLILHKNNLEKPKVDLCLNFLPRPEDGQKIYLYLKLDELQSLDLGRLNFGEALIPIKINTNKTLELDCDTILELFGTSKSVFKGWNLNRVLNSQNPGFELTSQISSESQNYGSIKSMRFILNNNRISAP